MDGLECSEIWLNDIENNFTIGAEFYSKKYIEAINAVKQCSKVALLSNISRVITDGDHGVSEYQAQGVLYLLSENVKCGYLDLTDVKYIDICKHLNLRRSALHPRDIVVTKTGIYFGKSAVIPPYIHEANMIAHVGKIVLKSEYNPYFVSSFLNCKYGYYQLRRRGIKATRPEIKLIEFGDIVVPKFSDKFDKHIEQLILYGNDTKKKADDTYQEAEEILLFSLKLDKFIPSKENTSIKSFSQVDRSGRMDAEYYQPKYDEIEEKLSKFPQIKMKALINYPVCSGSTPKAGDSRYYTDENSGIPFVRAVDIVNSRIDTKNFIYVTPFIHNNLLKRTKLKKYDVLFSIAGTVGRCGVFDHDFEANINQAVAILRFSEEKIKRQYLVQYFNSSIGKLIIGKYSRQGLQTNLNLDEVSELSIPIIRYDIQEKIAKLISESFILREQSELLLKAAVRAVEIAIEQDESVAMAYLEEQTKGDA